MLPLIALAATPLLIDLGNIQAWQALVVMLGALGLSPAPWILGLATGRIQFTKTAREDYATRVADLVAAHAAATVELAKHHAALIAEKDKAYTELETSRDYYRKARLEEAGRNELLTTKLSEGYDEFGRTTAAVLAALTEGKDATA